MKDPQPQGRVYHTAVLSDSNDEVMYIFGGSDSHGYFDDLWALNFGISFI